MNRLNRLNRLDGLNRLSRLKGIYNLYYASHTRRMNEDKIQETVKNQLETKVSIIYKTLGGAQRGNNRYYSLQFFSLLQTALSRSRLSNSPSRQNSFSGTSLIGRAAFSLTQSSFAQFIEVRLKTYLRLDAVVVRASFLASSATRDTSLLGPQAIFW